MHFDATKSTYFLQLFNLGIKYKIFIFMLFLEFYLTKTGKFYILS